MPRNPYVKWGGIIALLVLANIVNYIYWHWGLITVKVTDAPLGKVIKSIEWQGWVTIYTNLPLDQKVTMYVDHVPLAEAMETLAANVSGPAVGDTGGPRGGGGAPPGNPNGPGGPPPSDTPPGPGAPPPSGNLASTGPGGGAPTDAPGGNGGARGGRGGRGGGGGRGGFGGGGGGFGGGGAQWNLAFFVAPTTAQAKQEIRAFQEGVRDDDTRIYNYPTPLQMVATDSDMPASDPREQSWSGIKPVTDSAPPPAPAAPAAPAANTPAPATDSTPTTPTVQTYLQAFAQSADIWIMAPGSWAPEVATPPSPNSSIISAVKNFVSRSHGAVIQAIVLRVGRGGSRAPGGGGGGGGGGRDMEAMEDRMRNAINGLPPDARADALDQLNQEVQFYRDVKTAPAAQQPTMIRDHMLQKMAAGNNNSRRSPAKRAQRYQRMVANRVAAQGKK